MVYEDDDLVQCRHHDPGEGAIWSEVYRAWGGRCDAHHLAEREHYLAHRAFSVLPRFSGPRVRTRRYEGVCYEVGDSYLVIEAILGMLGESGSFVGKAAKVTLVERDGTEEVLYRAIDSWPDLKPASLPSAVAASRSERLRAMGRAVIGKPVDSVFGKHDALMGSGVDYRLYYMTDGLAVVSVGADPTRKAKAGIITRVWVSRPGEAYYSLDKWLLREAGATPTIGPETIDMRDLICSPCPRAPAGYHRPMPGRGTR